VALGNATIGASDATLGPPLRGRGRRGRRGRRRGAGKRAHISALQLGSHLFILLLLNHLLFSGGQGLFGLFGFVRHGVTLVHLALGFAFGGNAVAAF
jgi:hypothetical protein